ncbi:VCBS repeat-containing protein [Streptomyces tricolor]|nr:VCBS repeat-containing protein [Streptomyces tricolor]
MADFDRDGWSDLVVVAGEEQGGDDPIPPRVAELRLGPFSGTGRSRRVVQLDLGATKDIAVADYDHDRHPDLAAYTYSGDGTYETQARLGDAHTGLAPGTRAYTRECTAHRLPPSGHPLRQRPGGVLSAVRGGEPAG